MKILIDINHPAHVHLFKIFAWKMKSKGHTVLFTTRNKEIAHILLKIFGFEFISFGKPYKKLLGKLLGIFKYDLMLWRVSLKYKPDVLVSMGGIYASHVSKLINRPHILWTDTENANFQHALSIPFADVVMNPVCFKKKFKKNQIFYHGYHELAYLHPNHFTPDPSILNELGVAKDQKYMIMRFVAWNASHDVGHTGILTENKIKAVTEFSKHARVFITSEGELPNELKRFQIKIPVDHMHNVLAFCSLLYGESATMASECAVLGVPSIYIDNEGRGYTNELEQKYGLVFNYTESLVDQERSIQKGIELLSQNVANDWKAKHQKLIKEKIDVTSFMIWFVENYPQSKDIMLKNPERQFDFK